MTDGTTTALEHSNHRHGRAASRLCRQHYFAIMQLAGGRIRRRHGCMDALAVIEVTGES